MRFPIIFILFVLIVSGCTSNAKIPESESAETQRTEFEISAEERARRESELWESKHAQLDGSRRWVDQSYFDLVDKMKSYKLATGDKVDLKAFKDRRASNIEQDVRERSDPETIETHESWERRRALLQEYSQILRELEAERDRIESNFRPELVDYSVQLKTREKTGVTELKVTIYQGSNKPDEKPRNRMIYAYAFLEEGQPPTYTIDGHFTWPASSNGWGLATSIEIMASERLDEDYRITVDARAKPIIGIPREQIIAMADSENLMVAMYGDRPASPRIGPVDITPAGKQALKELVARVEELSQTQP